jgi:hypothetical protein
MADVEISYNNSVIASLSDSGTEVLETNSTFMADDITITYEKSGGGGGSTTVSVYNCNGNIYYVDSADGTLKYVNTGVWTGSVPSGSMVVLHWNGPKPPSGSTLTNLTLVYSVSNGSRASYPVTDFCIAD